MTHTFIVNIFNIFVGFVKMVKLPNVVRKVKISFTIDLQHVRIFILVIDKLIDQLID